jgi:hypothetical protein
VQHTVFYDFSFILTALSEIEQVHYSQLANKKTKALGVVVLTVAKPGLDLDL